MNKYTTLYRGIALAVLTFTANGYAAEQRLSFSQTINIAQKNDPWLERSHYKQQSLESLSQVANTEADPSVSIAFANLPTNTFDFNQENMTQFKVGVSQMFARGDSLAINSKQLQLKSEQEPFQRQDRISKVAVMAGSLWLDLFQAQQSIRLIEANRNLFEQLSQLAEASYSSGVGKTRQYDIVSAQLELTRLEDRVNQLKLEQNRYQGMLEQWLSEYRLRDSRVNELHSKNDPSLLLVSHELPQLELSQKSVIYDAIPLNPEQLAAIFSKHPSVIAVDKNIEATRIGVDLAKQKYKPQWGINASYGYRADDAMSNSRADLFSLGVVFDLPLFTQKRQDNEVKSAISKTEANKTEKLLLIRQLMSTFSSAKGRLLRVKERQTLYTKQLMPQIKEQAQAYLTAYTNNDGDFSDVVRARIAQLNAQLDFLAINVQEQKIILEVNYLLVNTTQSLKVGVNL
jgi:outer membrane protein TolC